MRACLVVLSLLLAEEASARELATAPQLRIIGFSQDGRYFGFEQSGGNGVTDDPAFAVDVIDRTTGASAPGFPRGATQLTFNSEPNDPRQAAIAGLRLNEDDEVERKQAVLSSFVVRSTSPALRRLGIGVPGRRLGGRPITDLTETVGPVRVMRQPDILGAHPGDTPRYEIQAELRPPGEGSATCREREDGVSYEIAVTLVPEIPSTDPDAARREPEAHARRTATIPWTWPADMCVSAVRVTDVILHEASGTLAVMLAILVDTGNADAAEYQAVLFQLR